MISDEDRRLWLDQLSHCADPNKQVILACSALKRVYRRVLTGDRPANQCQIFLLTTTKEVLGGRLASRKNHYAKSSLLDSQLETLELRHDDETNVQMVDVTEDSIQKVVDEIVDRLRKRH